MKLNKQMENGIYGYFWAKIINLRTRYIDKIFHNM